MKTILVIGGFKCATSTLCATFAIKKSHSLYDETLLTDDITTILFPFRDNAEVFPSALFQNIITPSYCYSPFNPTHGIFKEGTEAEMQKIILETPVDVLIDFFKDHLSMFEDAIHLNNITRIKSFNSTYGCAINYLSRGIQTFTIVVNNIPRKLIAFDSNTLTAKFEEIKMAIFSKPTPNIPLLYHNISGKKWYGAKYIEFMKVFNVKMKKLPRVKQLRQGSTYALIS
jgi:hypothetical protein